MVANCPSQIMAGQLFGDLNFDVTGLTGETPISAANLVLDLQSKIYAQGILSLPETVDLCTVPEAYYYNMLWSPYFNDPDVDVDMDGAITILDFISRMNCPL
ncbi:MAG: hypothetical protein CSA81_02190 [Acidobacteria bacterium]|nr:MAG: hypothetical protein CSA81_02190 [Acidobacteriota bacterium]